MPAQPINIHIVTQRLEGEVLLAEPLLFPAALLCHVNDTALSNAVRRLASELAAAVPPMDWHRHILAEPPAVGRIRLSVDPPKRQPLWAEPLDCSFDYLWWTHGDEGVIAYVPALGIEVIAESFEHLEKIAPEQLRSALRRTAAGESLYRVALLRRVESISLHGTDIEVAMQTPKQRYADLAGDQEKARKPLIDQVGHALSADRQLEPAYEVDDVVSRMAESLSGRTPRSVLLVGPAGVGKTAAVRELVRRRGEFSLDGSPFWTNSGARLVAGMSGFGMWQERCTQLCQESLIVNRG